MDARDWPVCLFRAYRIIRGEQIDDFCDAKNRAGRKDDGRTNENCMRECCKSIAITRLSVTSAVFLCVVTNSLSIRSRKQDY